MSCPKEAATKAAIARGGRQMRQARRKLGLKPVSFRPISLLAKCLKDGKARFMEFAKDAARIEPRLAYVAENYESLNAAERASVSIDEICAKYGIDALHYIAVVGEVALKYRGNCAILIVANDLFGIVVDTTRQATGGAEAEGRGLPSFEKSMREIDEMIGWREN